MFLSCASISDNFRAQLPPLLITMLFSQLYSTKYAFFNIFFPVLLSYLSSWWNKHQSFQCSRPFPSYLQSTPSSPSPCFTRSSLSCQVVVLRTSSLPLSKTTCHLNWKVLTASIDSLNDCWRPPFSHALLWMTRCRTHRSTTLQFQIAHRQRKISMINSDSLFCDGQQRSSKRSLWILNRACLLFVCRRSSPTARRHQTYHSGLHTVKYFSTPPLRF